MLHKSKPVSAFFIVLICLPVLVQIGWTALGQGNRTVGAAIGGLTLLILLGWIYTLVKAQGGNDYLEALIGGQDSTFVLVVIFLFLWTLIPIDFTVWVWKTIHALLRSAYNKAQETRWRLSDLWFRATGM